MKLNARHQQAGPAGTQAADINGHLGRVGSGDQVRGAQKIEEVGARQPAAAGDHLFLHHADVDRRTAERGHAQPEIENSQFQQRASRLRALHLWATLYRHHAENA